MSRDVPSSASMLRDGSMSEVNNMRPVARRSSSAATYPAPVRGWIERNGGLTEKPIFLRSRQLAALYPRCR